MSSVNIQIVVTSNISNLSKILFALIMILKKSCNFWTLIFSNGSKNTFLTISTYLISPNMASKEG